MEMGTELRMKLHSELYNAENLEILKDLISNGIGALLIDTNGASVDTTNMRILINKSALSIRVGYDSIKQIIYLSFAKFLADNKIQLTCPLELLCNVTSTNN